MVIRVSLVDDHQLVAQALARALHSERDIVVVGTASTVRDIPRALGANPDVVLMDYLLPDGTGADGARLVKALRPHTRVIMLTAVDSDRSLLEAAAADADGYLTKDRQIGDVVSAVRRAVEQPGDLRDGLEREIHRRDDRRHAADGQFTERLTPRELDVLQALAEGLGAQAACARLGVTRNTFRTHTQRILAKLNAHSKLEAVSVALAAGLVAVAPATDARAIPMYERPARERPTSRCGLREGRHGHGANRLRPASRPPTTNRSSEG